ncbi:MAG: hypothetical protein H7256_01200 [Bdellovibrio sp.]|nr:hypothetical protein [Bdellovibrio sp.]
MKKDIVIFSSKIDTLLITTIGLTSTLFALVVAHAFKFNEVTPLMWLLLVVGIDVSHVYSTLYRTYFSSTVSPALKPFLTLIPIICFCVAFFAALRSTSFFWTVLVYVAIFHFSRQQIGFLRLFTDVQGRKTKLHRLNEISINAWTLGSILIWHLQGPKTFQWFVADDFMFMQSLKVTEPFIKYFILLSFVVVMAINLRAFAQKQVSKQVVLVLLSTFVSWYVPIVILNSDFVFTFANVVSHGIPYLVLVYSREVKQNTSFNRLHIFISVLIFFAFVEEALWDGFIWRDHAQFFESFYFLPQLADGSFVKAFFLAVLIAPQLIHYVLDGFIWKKKYQPSMVN